MSKMPQAVCGTFKYFFSIYWDQLLYLIYFIPPYFTVLAFLSIEEASLIVVYGLLKECVAVLLLRRKLSVGRKSWKVDR